MLRVNVKTIIIGLIPIDWLTSYVLNRHISNSKVNLPNLVAHTNGDQISKSKM